MQGGYAAILIKSYNKMDKRKRKTPSPCKTWEEVVMQLPSSLVLSLLSLSPCCCPASSPSRRPVHVGVPAPIVVVVTVPFAVVAMPLLFFLLPSLSLLLPMSIPQAVMVVVGSGGADTSSFCPCPHFQQQQGMLGNATHCPVVVPRDVIKDCGSWSGGSFAWTDL